MKNEKKVMQIMMNADKLYAGKKELNLTPAQMSELRELMGLKTGETLRVTTEKQRQILVGFFSRVAADARKKQRFAVAILFVGVLTIVAFIYLIFTKL